MSDNIDTSNLVENGKNAKQILCIRCKSKILPPQMGTYEESQYELESMNKETVGQKEMLKQFFRVEDMFDFDNVGFTNTVDTTKFLSCADCDVGPLGYHNLTTKISYVALARVAYAD
eukprot:TRINITY_DN10871_c0_g1_i1.p1 TRINITY_DN10871_c0_g1~~TRINITY_DN10871_c0_g1_i1.p1  ORF type:complete len:117 (-),score=27.67 TRINITY_DN10871_c0_g1_i1:83-433(-)